MTRTARVGLISVVLVLALSACGHTEHALSATQEPRWVKSELYFGRSIAGGGEVTEAQWGSFLAASVTPRFPQGLTVLSGHGQWLGKDGKVAREASKLLILIHQATEETRRKIAAIITEYKKEFRQESVLLLRSEVEARF